MQIALFLLGILLFLIGFGLLFGFSWALLAADVISLISGGHVTGGYRNNNKETYKGVKSVKFKALGLFLLVLGVLGFAYSLMLP